MDPRREALRETLELLKKEGWAPARLDPDLSNFEGQLHPLGRSFVPGNWFLTSICVVSVLINVALISFPRNSAENLPGQRASIRLLELDLDPFGPRDLTMVEELSLTIEGVEVWKQQVKHARRFELQGTSPFRMDSHCLVQLWAKVKQAPSVVPSTARPILLGQAKIKAENMSDASVIIVLQGKEDFAARLSFQMKMFPLPTSR